MSARGRRRTKSHDGWRWRSSCRTRIVVLLLLLLGTIVLLVLLLLWIILLVVLWGWSTVKVSSSSAIVVHVVASAVVGSIVVHPHSSPCVVVVMIHHSTTSPVHSTTTTGRGRNKSRSHPAAASRLLVVIKRNPGALVCVFLPAIRKGRDSRVFLSTAGVSHELSMLAVASDGDVHPMRSYIWPMGGMPIWGICCSRFIIGGPPIPGIPPPIPPI